MILNQKNCYDYKIDIITQIMRINIRFEGLIRNLFYLECWQSSW